MSSTEFPPAQPNPGAGPAVSDSPSGPNDPEVTWWCRILTRVAASIAGVVAFVLGIVACIGLSAICIVAGIIQMLASVILLIFEAPICCQFFEITKPIAGFAERRSFLQKAFIYGGMAIPPIFMCFGASTLVGSGFIFAVGVIYGLMSLGRKADRATMLARASAEEDKIEIVPHDQLRR